MQSRPICLASLATALVICTACSKNEPQSQKSANYESDDGSSPPNIAPSAAPGVAFNYAYDFNLPDERISATQEAHASECEKLGLARCRITGMSYNVDQDEQVTAELDVKLDPAIARQFGKSAQQLVQSNDGKLIRLAIGSSDEGQKIEQATKQKTDTSTQISQLEQELAKTKPGTQARSNLLSQIQALQQQAADQSQAIAASQATLASTPMEFHYYGRGGVPGFRGNPVREAWQTFVTTVVWMVGILLQALAVLIPVALLVAGLISLWRTRPMRIVRAWIKGPEESND
ncbi:MAG: hypothetical protein ACJ8FS_11375 [Sphingomicrobium sp.]